MTPSVQEPSSFNTLFSRSDSPKILAEAGVQLIITTSGNNSRRLRQEVGIAMSYGLGRRAGQKAITESPGVLFPTKIGRLAVGYSPDIVLWDGDPFELSSNVKKLWVNGLEVSLQNRQEKLAKRYLEKKP